MEKKYKAPRFLSPNTSSSFLCQVRKCGRIGSTAAAWLVGVLILHLLPPYKVRWERTGKPGWSWRVASGLPAASHWRKELSLGAKRSAATEVGAGPCLPPSRQTITFETILPTSFLSGTMRVQCFMSIALQKALKSLHRHFLLHDDKMKKKMCLLRLNALQLSDMFQL